MFFAITQKYHDPADDDQADKRNYQLDFPITGVVNGQVATGRTGVEGGDASGDFPEGGATFFTTVFAGADFFTPLPATLDTAAFLTPVFACFSAAISISS